MEAHRDPENGDCEGSKALCPFRFLGCETTEVFSAVSLGRLICFLFEEITCLGFIFSPFTGK